MGLIIKVLALGSSSSSDIYNIEPGSDVHRSNTEVFDFSNTKITESVILGILALILALSYIFKKHIIRRMTRNQPSAPVAYNVLAGVPQLPQFAPQLALPIPAIPQPPSYQSLPLSSIPSADKLAKMRYSLYNGPSYNLGSIERPNISAPTEAEDMEAKMRELQLNAKIASSKA